MYTCSKYNILNINIAMIYQCCPTSIYSIAGSPTNDCTIYKYGSVLQRLVNLNNWSAYHFLGKLQPLRLKWS